MEPASGREIINREYLDQTIDIVNSLPPATRQTLINLLKKYNHVFAWTPTYMVRVDREVIEHKIMIKPGTKEIKQKNGFKWETRTWKSMSRSPS